MTSAEHLAMSEYYVGIYDKTWTDMVTNPILMRPTTVVDAMVNENLLHAADVHLKLAEAKSRIGVVTADGATLEQRLGGS